MTKINHSVIWGNYNLSKIISAAEKLNEENAEDKKDVEKDGDEKGCSDKKASEKSPEKKWTGIGWWCIHFM